METNFVDSEYSKTRYAIGIFSFILIFTILSFAQSLLLIEITLSKIFSIVKKKKN